MLFDPHLFYQGKEVGKKFLDGLEVGKAGCESELDNNTTHYVEDSLPQKAKWSRVICTFPNVKGKDKEGETHSLFGPPHFLATNPGDYEFKESSTTKCVVKLTASPFEFCFSSNHFNVGLA